MMIWPKISVKFEFMRNITLQIGAKHVLGVKMAERVGGCPRFSFD